MIDDLIMSAAQKNYPIDETALRTIQAGGDVFFIGHGYDPIDHVLATLKIALTSENVTEQRVNQRIERILKLKKRKHSMTQNMKILLYMHSINRQMSS